MQPAAIWAFLVCNQLWTQCASECGASLFWSPGCALPSPPAVCVHRQSPWPPWPVPLGPLRFNIGSLPPSSHSSDLPYQVLAPCHLFPCPLAAFLPAQSLVMWVMLPSSPQLSYFSVPTASFLIQANNPQAGRLHEPSIWPSSTHFLHCGQRRGLCKDYVVPKRKKHSSAPL